MMTTIMSNIYRAPLCAGTALSAAACLSTKAQNELRRHRYHYCHSTDVDTGQRSLRSLLPPTISSTQQNGRVP